MYYTHTIFWAKQEALHYIPETYMKYYEVLDFMNV